MIKSWLIEYLKRHNCKSFIDVGCGFGATAGTIKSTLPYIYVKGIDISREYIKKAKESYPEVKFAVMDARKLQFKPKSFEVAHTNGVLIHIPHGDIEGTIRNIMWMTRTGLFLESQGKEEEGMLLPYDPVKYWEGRTGKNKPDYIEQNTKYYFSHPYEKIFKKLGLNFKIEKDWGDESKTRLYRIW